VGRIDYIYYTPSDRLQLADHKHVISQPVKLDNGEKMYLTDHIGLKGEFVLYA
jgi:hypothetical protein